MNIEDQIRRAMEEGQFNDLPGKGKPLKLDDNPSDDPDWRMANKILKDGGYSLPWIENRHEIEENLVSARAELQRAWNWRQENQESFPSTRIEAEWNRAELAFRKKIEAINKKIFSYNLEAPNIHLQRLTVNIEKEIEEVKSHLPPHGTE